MFDRAVKFMRDEAVLCVAFVLACASVVVSGDVGASFSYIDWRVIGLLFCLMAAVAGLKASGVLARIAGRLVAGERSKRVVCLALVMLPFFASMLVTNDVALLAFVPIAVLALDAAGWRDAMARVVVLQAVAANLGGMVTPVGNPQNLFIFTTYRLSVGDFFGVLAPFGALAFVALAVTCLAFGGSRANVVLRLEDSLDARKLALHAVLFAMGVLAVVRVVPWEAALVAVAAALLVFDRRVFLRVDYGLLATFACFFVFSGNLAHLPAVRDFVGGLMDGHAMLTSLLASQVISNVPASVLLAGFTGDWQSLLIGVDIGGLGTPVASLASLIALRLYLHAPGADLSRFLREFALANAAGLALMLALYAALYA